jgi:hypothetical protein
VRECGSCRAVNPDDADFCSGCGAAISEAGGGTAGTVQAGVAPQTPSPYAQPGGPPYYGSPYPQQPYPMVMTVNSNGKAIASLVLGIFGIFSFPIISSIVALVLGVQARREIAASGGWQTGDSMARAGIILGWVGIAIYSLLFLILIIVAVSDPNAFSMPLQMGLLIRI